MTPLERLRQIPVHLVVRAWSTQGGTERYCHGFARWLVQHGVDTTIWCQRVETDAAGMRLRRLRPEGRGRIGRLLATAHASGQMRVRGLRVGFLRARGFDVLRAGGGAHAAAMRALKKGSLADQVERYVDRAALRSAGVVVANSERARADIVAESERSPEDVVLVRNGVDLNAFQVASHDRLRDHVVFVGHGFARKGLRTAIEAMVHLPGVKLWVVGHDRRQRMYERMCLEHGVAGQVEFKGGSLDPSHWLRQAGALVLPTRYDPSANVVLESMACGVPPVTTATDGASEVVPMPWMIVDDPTDARAVARALRRALTEPGLGSRCREEAEKWTHHRSFSEFAQVLESACREVE